MRFRIPLLITVAVIAFLLNLVASDSGATPISSGEVSLVFKTPPTPTEPWELAIDVWAMTPSPDGRIDLELIGASGGTIQSVPLWEGSVASGDSISLHHSFPPPPPGMYALSPRFVPFPERPGTGGASKAAYVLVTLDTVFVEWGRGGRRNLRDQILYDARKCGLGEVPPDSYDSLAPDLAKRWQDLYHPKGITTIRFVSPSKGESDSLAPRMDSIDSVGVDHETGEPASPDSGSQRMQFWDPDSMWLRYGDMESRPADDYSGHGR